MSSAGLPDEWLQTQLGDVIPYGKTVKAEPSEIDDDCWVLELEDIEKDSSRILQRLTYLERKSKSTKNRFEKGDVLYGKLRPYLNKIVVADSDGVCTTEIIPMSGGSMINNRYLFYWLKHPEFLAYVTRVGYGVNMPRLGTKDGEEAPFVLAPFAEQKQIAAKLDELLAQVGTIKARLDAIPAILKRFRQSVLAAAVSGRLTEEWRGLNSDVESGEHVLEKWLRERRLKFDSEQALLIQEGKQKRAKKYKEPTAPDLETRDVKFPARWATVSVSQFAECLDHLRVPVTKADRLSAQGLYPYFGANGEVDRVDQYLFDDDLVLVTEDETFYGRTKPIAYRFTGKCWVNNHAHVLRAPTKDANDYICYALMYYDVIPWLSGTTGRAKLTQGALNSLPLGLPSEEEQSEIVQRVDELLTYAEQIEQRVKDAQSRVNHLTQSVLAKAFRGELTAEWREQNPDLISGENSAQALLEHIKAEQVNLNPKKKGRKKNAA